MKIAYRYILLTLVLSFQVAQGLFNVPGLRAQVDRVDYSRMARPELESEEDAERERENRTIDREKIDWQKYILAGPISYDSHLFLNSNLIDETSTTAGPQNESSIAISPVDPKFLIASAVDFRNGAWIYISTDGGKSWKNRNLGIVNDSWQSGNDPSVGFNHLGHAYLMYGAFPRPFTGESGVYIARSTDRGETWQSHITVIEHRGTMTPDSAFEDKYYIEIDRSTSSPYRSWMYTPWKRVTDRDSATEIVFTRSTDGGLTWSSPVGVSPRKPGTSTHITFGQSFPLVRTGPDGEVYTVWNDGPAHSIGFARSTDGGTTWSTPTYPVTGYTYLGTARYITATRTVIDTIDKGTPNERYESRTVTDTTEKYHVLKGTFRAETYPTLTVDNSESSHRGNLYLCWASDSVPQIHFIRSTDRGATWSAPKTVHSNPSNDKWWPWISVDETSGNIAVMYSDSRDDPKNIGVHTYVSLSRDGGETWIDRRATDVASDFRKNPFVNQIFAGDYSGNSFYDDHIYPSFLDTREDNDVYTVVININKPLPVDNLRAASSIDSLTSVRLTWNNPPLESTFSIPLSDYSLAVRKDGVTIATLPSGTTTFSESGLMLDRTYNYEVIVVAGTDSSVARDVDFTAGGARLPLAPRLSTSQKFQESASLTVSIPAVRADSVTPLTNLATVRLFRDGELVRVVPVTQNDTGRALTVADTTERGYHRYWSTVVDGAGTPLESRTSDTILLYVGPYSEFMLGFESPTPVLTTGKWERTGTISFEGSSSLTDSPQGDYDRYVTSTVQLYPYRSSTNDIRVDFAHIALIHKSDTAVVEYSLDSGATWSVLDQYVMDMYPEWADGSADPGDWKTEQLIVPVPPARRGGLVLVRFRLSTSIAQQADGWYLDNVAVGNSTSGVAVESASRISAQFYPNPTRGKGVFVLSIPESRTISIELYDHLGRHIETLVRDMRLPEGRQSLNIELEDIPSGTYIWRLTSGGDISSGSIILHD